MRQFDDLILNAVREERMRLASRRGFLGGAAKLAGGGAVAAAATFGPATLGLQTLFAQEAAVPSDLDILQYALTLEHLENAFYREGLRRFGNAVRYIRDVADHERIHVATLTRVIRDLGANPVEERDCYDFGYRTERQFLRVAQALENTGVSAYDGAIQFVDNPDLRTAAATIATVEARHASYLNFVNGDNPFPVAFDEPMSRMEVLNTAKQFNCNNR